LHSPRVRRYRMRTLFELLSRLPLEWLYRMGAVAGFIVFRVVRWRRAIARENIARAFPELGESARASILRGSYRNLGEIFAEFVWSYRATSAQIAERVSIDNPEVITDETRSGRSVLLMTAHYCNWEWQVPAGNGVLDHPMYPVYKPQRLASLDRFIVAARARFGGTPIPHKTLTREMIRHRRDVRVYAMVADQVPTIDEPKHWTRFLGVTPRSSWVPTRLPAFSRRRSFSSGCIACAAATTGCIWSVLRNPLMHAAPTLV
jgi:Kdo2-lipid IVA lauroyltransferase/acyltransferase